MHITGQTCGGGGTANVCGLTACFYEQRISKA